MDKRRELRPGYPSTQTSSIQATSALPFQNEIAITRTQSRDESLGIKGKEFESSLAEGKRGVEESNTV